MSAQENLDPKTSGTISSMEVPFYPLKTSNIFLSSSIQPAISLYMLWSIPNSYSSALIAMFAVSMETLSPACQVRPSLHPSTDLHFSLDCLYQDHTDISVSIQDMGKVSWIL